MKLAGKILMAIAPVLAAGAILVLHFGSARAAFNANEIIDDGVFNNTTSMSAAQIDSWLNSNFPSSCISTNNGFASADPVGYNPTQGFLYGGAVSAGKVIYDAAQAYGINPQVLLTTLQKEEVLVTGSSGCATWQYTSAMGFSCTDSQHLHSYPAEGALLTPLYYKNGVPVTSISNTCVGNFDGTAGPQYAGFSEQVIWAAWLLEKGLQRSEGNVGWMVIKPNWDNSDESNCYSGPMTQGNFKRCRTDTSTVFYDGYVVIDGQSVHLNTGATATLYWYTPHFSGNQNFYNLFTSWFGSTLFPQPVGGSLLYQTSTGRIYLTTDTTRYYVSGWAMMVNYGLDTYPVLPVSDATIQQYSDGGDLTNLVIDSGGVYLVNNHARYHLSPSMCTAWGLSCFDNTVVKPLGSAFQTGYLQNSGELSQLSLQNGVIYEMSGGQKQPVANPKTLSDLGLGSTPVIVTSAINSLQPLGPLLITTPGVVQLATNSPLYYFNGTAYYLIYNMDSYFDWALTKAPQLSVPASSYATTLPVSTVLSSYITADDATKYVIDQGRKLSVPAGLGALWPDSQFTSPPSSALLNALPSSTLSQNVYSDAGVFVLGGGKKHYVSSVDDFPGLNITPGTTTKLRSDKLQAITSGVDAFPDGKLILTTNDGKIYVVNNHGLTYIPSPSIFTAYGYDWGKIFSYPLSVTSEYPVDSHNLGSMVNPAGDAYLVTSSTLYKLPASMATDYGVISSSLAPITDQAIKKTNIPTLPRFLYNSDDGKIYYASGKAIHYVTSLASFAAYGGLNSKPATVNSQFISLFTIAQPI